MAATRAAAIVVLAGVVTVAMFAPGQARRLPIDVGKAVPQLTTTVIDDVVVDMAPGTSEVDRLEPLDTPLPAAMQFDPGRVLPLSEAPVTRALALSRTVGRMVGEETAVFVVGQDGRPRVIDLANLRLVGGVDPQVIHSVEVLSTTLSPDGTRAAVVHRDAQTADGVLVIDLTSAEARRFPLPGPRSNFARVIWHPDGRELVVEDHEHDQTLLLNLVTGEVRVHRHDDPASPYGGLGMVATTHAPDRDIVRLSGGGPKDEPALSRWTPEGELVARHVLPATTLAPYGWDWGTPGWRHGNLVARTQRSGPRPGQGIVVHVIDLASGEFVRALHLAGHKLYSSGRTVRTRGVDSSPVLGWLDEETVLLADSGVVAWNIRTGRLRLVAQLHEGPGGAPVGYDAVGDLGR